MQTTDSTFRSSTAAFCAHRVPIAMTIAGSDSSGGAGIQADLKTFSAMGVYGASTLTALTAQNTCSVSAIHEVPADFVTQQLVAVLSDLNVGAIKIGMLASVAIIEATGAARSAVSACHDHQSFVSFPSIRQCHAYRCTIKCDE